MINLLSSKFRNIFNFFRTLIVLTLFSLVIVFCDKNSTNGEKEIVFPETGVSFYEHVQPLFDRTCGFESGCHSPSDEPTSRKQLTYSILVTKSLLLNFTLSSTGEKLIDLNIHQKNPDIAPLYLILAVGYPREQEDLMPPIPREPLNQNQLNGILQWIKEGCPD
ncbi:hypothetical protein [Caldithrix abyssi]|uniref:Cytochrome C Planctomycete-type domain-containing protein n=1 Tax=Caldithrix abyssi DSM 13497 TaxID=880073 RepID=H1XRD3_CALAY|nr:hypothetical protein [Caldithrix abyssi]APF18405.1 hypothetical protein Cabys_1656 [Caldithrix abyssi DSM 13497]EHO42414.1 hypothetical protein Calab_2807 [Caldithrix abyssi DSM 13497]